MNAQAPIIQSLSRNGELVGTNLEPGTTATVEWAPTAHGPWKGSWDDLTSVSVEADGTIQVNVPMFYRLLAIPANPDPARLAWIPPGTFLMGSPETEAERQPRGQDETQHQVTISRGFWMGKYEVSQREYQEVIGNNPSHFRNGSLPFDSHTGTLGAGGPVTNDVLHPLETRQGRARLAWNDATNYCARLTERERAAGRLPEGYVYRLPTEAEWEYSCRVGTTTAFHYGGELRSGMANFFGGSEYDASVGTIVNPTPVYIGRTIEVGSYEPNAWGLYDMHGNVAEWCYDWFGDYPVGPATDPTGPATGTSRVLRGGCWWWPARALRSANRIWFQEGSEFFNGFRVVLAHPVE